MTRQENGDVLYAVYGTLRNGHGNNRLLQKSTVEFLGTLQTPPNYTMVGRGAGFPYVGENGSTAITIEIFRTNDEEVIRRVNGLEGYSGVRNHSSNWYDTCDVDTPWGTANMFINNESVEGAPERAIIHTGDFNNQILEEANV